MRQWQRGRSAQARPHAVLNDYHRPADVQAREIGPVAQYGCDVIGSNAEVKTALGQPESVLPEKGPRQVANIAFVEPAETHVAVQGTFSENGYAIQCRASMIVFVTLLWFRLLSL